MTNGGTDAELIREYKDLEEQEKEYAEEMIKDPVLNWLEQLNVYTDPVTARPIATNTVSIKSMMEPIEGADIVGFLGEFVLPLIGLYRGHKLATESLYDRSKKEIAIAMLRGKRDDAKNAAERAGPQAGGYASEEVMRDIGRWQSEVDKDLRFLKVTTFDQRYNKRDVGEQSA